MNQKSLSIVAILSTVLGASGLGFGLYNTFYFQWQMTNGAIGPIGPVGPPGPPGQNGTSSIIQVMNFENDTDFEYGVGSISADHYTIDSSMRFNITIQNNSRVYILFKEHIKDITSEGLGNPANNLSFGGQIMFNEASIAVIHCRFFQGDRGTIYLYGITDPLEAGTYTIRTRYMKMNSPAGSNMHTTSDFREIIAFELSSTPVLGG